MSLTLKFLCREFLMFCEHFGKKRHYFFTNIHDAMTINILCVFSIGPHLLFIDR